MHWAPMPALNSSLSVGSRRQIVQSLSSPQKSLVRFSSRPYCFSGAWASKSSGEWDVYLFKSFVCYGDKFIYTALSMGKEGRSAYLQQKETSGIGQVRDVPHARCTMVGSCERCAVFSSSPVFFFVQVRKEEGKDKVLIPQSVCL